VKIKKQTPELTAISDHEPFSPNIFQKNKK